MPTPANSITVTAQSVIVAALQEIEALSPGEQPSIEDSAWVLQKLQRLIDEYNAREPMVYSVNFQVFTLPIDTQPITIGPGAAFDINQRPVSIESASLILNNGTPGSNDVEVPLNIRDADWWAGQAIKGLQSTLPTDLYYNPAWPDGQIYLWPVPTAVNQLRLQLRGVLGQITSYSQSFSMPPAYWNAILYRLAVSLCPSFGKQAGPDLLREEARALKAVEGNNISSPRLFSDSPSQSSTSRSRPDFNFLTGLSQ